MPNRRTVLAAAAGSALIAGTPAYASADIRSLVDTQLAKLKEQYDTVAIGAFRKNRRYTVNGDRIFQIGSITKTFTGLALAIADRAGRLSIDDLLAEHLPWPSPKGITLAQLSSHTSGLPRIPPGLIEDPELDPKDPYAHFTEPKLIEALKNTTLVTEPGKAYAYSNYGTGVLGHALTPDYPALIRDQIAGPLGLKDTAVTLTREQRRRKVQGYDAEGMATPDWTLPTMAGAGALYGTVDDLLRYQCAHLGEAPRQLRAALELVRQPRFRVSPTLQVALGWHLAAMPSGRTAVWHDGGTGGFSSYTAFCPERSAGVSILVNKFNSVLDPNAIEILDAL
jgi:D-alanyl-D-alanine-carboxypeptidase/D-alanyl-D-alanine-endopeptidase